MSKEVGSRIKDIFENSDKAEFIEKISVALDTEGCKMVVIFGIPNEHGNLDMDVWQFGHCYLYEEAGFIHEALNIIDNHDTDEET